MFKARVKDLAATLNPEIQDPEFEGGGNTPGPELNLEQSTV
jgi:hypothetical protein